MPYNPETEQFYQAPGTVVDSTPDGDTVKEGFDDRLTPALSGVYTDLNLLKADGMIGVGIPATTTARGIGRVATLADMAPGAAVNNGPAFLAAGSDAEKTLLRVSDKYDIGEFYYFRHPTLKPGFASLQGGVISGVYQGKNITEWPIWEYLQTADGQLLLKTEAEWQAMTTATWHTNVDGTKIGWNGIGGAPYYVQDLGAGTLRMPDLRGMYAEAAGFDSLGVGDVQGDASRRLYALETSGSLIGAEWSSNSPMIANERGTTITSYSPSGSIWQPRRLLLDSSRTMPTGPRNVVRSWISLACAYLGIPAA